MNSLKKTLIISFLVGVVVSCVSIQPVTQSNPDNNKAYQVDYLFEHEGCKVYRFMDRGNYVYFTNCAGDVTSIENDSVGTHVINKIRNLPEK